MPKRFDNRFWVVLAAAFALLVQSSVGIAAPQASLLPGLTFDAFGNPLCLSGDHGADRDRHDPTRNCCTLGCGSAAAALPGPASVQLRLDRTGVSLPLRVVGKAPQRPARKYRPGNPRAPPELA